MNVKIEESWKELLAEEFNKPYFSALAAKVREEYGRKDMKIYPPGSEIFAAFNAAPVSSVKVVIIGQDPYHGPGQANGLCFSVNKGITIPPSLLNIFKEIQSDLGKDVPADGDLSRWASQGVLLLNSTLTVREHQPKSHASLGWSVFTNAVVDRLAETRSGIVFMLWGADAIRRGEHIDRSRHLVLTAPHPSPLSAYRGFFGCRHFSQANNYLRATGRSPIEW